MKLVSIQTIHSFGDTMDIAYPAVIVWRSTVDCGVNTCILVFLSAICWFPPAASRSSCDTTKTFCCWLRFKVRPSNVCILHLENSAALLLRATLPGKSPCHSDALLHFHKRGFKRKACIFQAGTKITLPPSPSGLISSDLTKLLHSFRLCCCFSQAERCSQWLQCN